MSKSTTSAKATVEKLQDQWGEEITTATIRQLSNYVGYYHEAQMLLAMDGEEKDLSPNQRYAVQFFRYPKQILRGKGDKQKEYLSTEAFLALKNAIIDAGKKQGVVMKQQGIAAITPTGQSAEVDFLGKIAKDLEKVTATINLEAKMQYTKETGKFANVQFSKNTILENALGLQGHKKFVDFLLDEPETYWNHKLEPTTWFHRIRGQGFHAYLKSLPIDEKTLFANILYKGDMSQFLLSKRKKLPVKELLLSQVRMGANTSVTTYSLSIDTLIQQIRKDDKDFEVTSNLDSTATTLKFSVGGIPVLTTSIDSYYKTKDASREEQMAAVRDKGAGAQFTVSTYIVQKAIQSLLFNKTS